MNKRFFPKTVKIAHKLVKEIVDEGDIVIDATAGNGHDTLFLAKLVGFGGKVYSFDIQKEAILSTEKKVREENLLKRIILINKGHQHLLEFIKESNIKAIMFNLGYLPGGDHSLITKPETTLVALESSINLLTKGGIITIVLYTGHPGGEKEAKAIENWVKKLSNTDFDCVCFNYLNKPNNPPYLICIQKIKDRVYF